MNIKRLPVYFLCLILFSISAFSQKYVLDTAFPTNTDGVVNFMETLPNGKIMIAGSFFGVNGVYRNRLARLNPDGTLDESFNANGLLIQTPIQPEISSMEILPDGKILIAGILDNGFTGPTFILRLDSNGLLDSSFTSKPRLSDNSPSGYQIRKVVQLQSGKILACGQFRLPNGNNRPYLARYNNDGTYDPTFTNTINSNCRDLEVQPDGKYIVAGYYTEVNGITRKGLTRFNPDDSIDPTFVPAFNPFAAITAYNRIKRLSDGSFIVGFNNGYGSLNSKLDSNGGAVLAYTRGSEFSDFVFQPNGKILLNGMNRMYTDGEPDFTLNRFNFTGQSELSLLLSSDNKLLIGGNFTNFTIDGVPQYRSYIARLIPQTVLPKPKLDFDGDGKDDLAVFRPSNSYWYMNGSTAGFSSTPFGLPQDILTPGDYDGDGKADISIFRNGIWCWLRSSDSTFSFTTIGQTGDIPQMGDYNGDGKSDVILYRPSNEKWYIRTEPGQGFITWQIYQLPMAPGIPVAGDYAGNEYTLPAVFRDGHWYYSISGGTTGHFQFGQAGDIPVQGDYDADGRTDFAVFRPSDGTWYIYQRTAGFYAVQFGISTDIPVPADYDGDGKTDIAVYRDGNWYMLQSSGGFQGNYFGTASDKPVRQIYSP